MRDKNVESTLKGTVIDIETSSDATLTAQVSKFTEGERTGEEITLVATDEKKEIAVSLSPHMARRMAKTLKLLANAIGEEPYTVMGVQGKAEGDDFVVCIFAESGDKAITATMQGGQARQLAKMINQLDKRCK